MSAPAPVHGYRTCERCGRLHLAMAPCRCVRGTGYACKECGAEAPPGIGYAVNANYVYRTPSSACMGWHVTSSK